MNATGIISVDGSATVLLDAIALRRLDRRVGVGGFPLDTGDRFPDED